MNNVDSLGSVLVVDDTPQNLTVACSILRNAGYDPRPATSGYEALELLDSDIPDLILLDISMPGMDGYETCRKLKADEKTRDIPVIFLTAANVAPEDSIRGFKEGAVDYIAKPVIDAILVARVGAHVRLRKDARVLAEKNRSLASAVEGRDRMLYILGHDLRNSFSGVNRGAEMLLNERETMDADTIREFLAAIEESSRRSLNLLEEILSWSKIETGKMPASSEAIDPAEAIAETVELFGPDAARKNIDLIVDTGDGVTPIAADRYAFAAILRNLTGNACKFSPPGGRVRLRAAAADDGFVEFAVEDSGPGLDPNQASGLGGGFVSSQLGTAGERGSGLGLIICGMLAKRLGTSIRVGISEYGGAKLSFTLPIASSARNQQ